ncbi:MAG: MerR family transcriptional regulator [Desulfobacterales bacterium]|nr:MAG: MerR family transcriptional regulator [Desulfobacterales bacterium]
MNAPHGKGYIRKQVAAILDMKPHTIQLYTDRGLVKPDVDAPKGRGTRRRYSQRNILELAMIRELGSMGVPLNIVKDILDNFRDESHAGFDLLEEFEKSRVFLIIYDHDSDEMGLEIQYRRRAKKDNLIKIQERFGLTPGPVKEVEPSNVSPRLRSTGGYRKAVILDLTQVWEEISPRL